MKEITDMKTNVGDYVDSVFPWLVLNLSKGMDSFTDSIYRGRNNFGVLFTNDDLNKIQTGIQCKLDTTEDYIGYEVTSVRYSQNEMDHSITINVKKCDRIRNIPESYCYMILVGVINQMIDQDKLLKGESSYQFIHDKKIHPDDLGWIASNLEKMFYQEHHLDISIDFIQTLNREFEYLLKVDPTIWGKIVPYSDPNIDYLSYKERIGTLNWLIERLKGEQSSISVSFELFHKLEGDHLQAFLEALIDSLLKVRENDFKIQGKFKSSLYYSDSEVIDDENFMSHQYVIDFHINHNNKEEDIMKETVINKDEFHLEDEYHHFYVASDDIHFIREESIDRFCYELAEEIEYKFAADPSKFIVEVNPSFDEASNNSEINLSKLIQDHVQHFLNQFGVPCRVQTPDVDWIAGGLFLKVVAIKK